MTLKEKFIKKYGIEMELPGHYLYEVFFYKPHEGYMVTVGTQVYPSSLEYYNLKSLETQSESVDLEFRDHKRDLSGRLTLTLYKLVDQRYVKTNQRLFERVYTH